MKRKTQSIQGEGFDGEANLSQNKDGQGQTGSNSSPPGFEGTVSKIGTAEEEGKSRTRKGKSGEVKRFTRSQLRKEFAQIEGNRTIEKRSPQGRRDSTETTASMRQEAEEAIKFGELLGVKVISHRENAIKRITSTLKASRVQRANRT